MSILNRTLPAVGEVLAGKYRIARKIGEGGMGVVFEAEHIRIRQRVAIKMLLPQVLDLPDVTSRFEREARAAGSLKSENTARVLDVDISEGGIPYMVMEFLDGQDLSDVLEKRGPLPIDVAVDYVLQACNAMAEAHASGIVHRDLKPSNLFLTGGERGTVKILDFGISKVENDKDTRVTATQTVVGTPLYMSPEQIRSAKHVDSRTDIWSLGIILYELLAGKTPFEGSTMAAGAAICIDAPPPIGNFRQGVPPDLEDAILVCLEKDSTKRYPNVQSLAVAIARFGSGAVRAPDASQPNIVLPRPSQRSITDASGPVPAASAGSISGTGRQTMPGWTTRSGTRASRSRMFAVVALAAIAGLAALAGVYVVAFRNPATANGGTGSITSTPPNGGTSVGALTTTPTTEPSTTASAIPTVSVGALPSALPTHPATATATATAGGNHPFSTGTGHATIKASGSGSGTAPVPSHKPTAAPTHL
jgi:serine/threonine-protein kinase